MITEAVIRVILHCSRCNTAFTDDFEDAGALVLWDPKELAETFPDGMQSWDDAGGWKRFGDRVVCENCWTYDGGGEVEKPPLPAVEDAKLNRERAGYTPVAALARVLHNTVGAAS